MSCFERTNNNKNINLLTNQQQFDYFQKLDQQQKINNFPPLNIFSEQQINKENEQQQLNNNNNKNKDNQQQQNLENDKTLLNNIYSTWSEAILFNTKNNKDDNNQQNNSNNKAEGIDNIKSKMRFFSKIFLTQFS